MSWPLVKLADLVVLKTGPFGSALHKTDYVAGGVPVINPTHIQAGQLLPDDDVTIGPSKFEELRDFALAVGDVILGRRGEMGRCAVVTDTEQGWLCGTGSIIVRPVGEVDSIYLQRFLSSPRVVRALEGEAVGTTMVNLNQKILMALEVPLPPLEQQRRIAAILDKVDALRAKRNESIAKLDQLLRSVFLQSFGDPIANSQNWPTKRLDETCSLINGRAFKQGEWEPAGLPIIRIQNLNDPDKPFNYTTQQIPEKFRVRNGDTLFSWSGTPGTSFGCFHWAGPEGWLNQHIFNVRLNGALLREFFIAQVNLKLTEFVSKAHGGVGLQHVTKSVIDETKLIVPPVAMQERFSKVVSAVDAQRSRLMASLSKIDAIFAAIQHRAFTGRL